MRTIKLFVSAMASAALVTTSAVAGGPVTIKGDNFVLTATPGPCKKDANCEIVLRLETQGSYHINDAYPYKFTPGPTKNPEGKPENVEFAKDTFSKANGDFKKDAEKVGTLVIKYKAKAAHAKVAGVYKMSVCSEQNCQLEQRDVVVDVDTRP
jgi:hypothetical protein